MPTPLAVIVIATSLQIPTIAGTLIVIIGDGISLARFSSTFEIVLLFEFKQFLLSISHICMSLFGNRIISSCGNIVESVEIVNLTALIDIQMHEQSFKLFIPTFNDEKRLTQRNCV